MLIPPADQERQFFKQLLEQIQAVFPQVCYPYAFYRAGKSDILSPASQEDK